MSLADITGFYSKIRNYVTLGLVAAVLFLSGYWYVTDLKLHTAQEQVKKEQALRKADQENYKAAQAAAAKKATEAKMKQEKLDREKAEQADAAYRDLLSKYNASLLRFAQSQRKTLGVNLSSTTAPPKGSNGPSSSTELPQGLAPNSVTITFDDAQICAVNTARLQSVHDWAVDLEKRNASQEGVVAKDDQ